MSGKKIFPYFGPWICSSVSIAFNSINKTKNGSCGISLGKEISFIRISIEWFQWFHKHVLKICA